MNADRRNEIVALINRQGTVNNRELMERFGISIETVRRDLDYLEKNGYLRKVYGGAVISNSLKSEPEYHRRTQVQFREKSAIAAVAASMILPGDAVYLGVGTTVQAMISHMKNAGENTVFTNALRTAVELSERHNCQAILPGGTLRAQELTLSGTPAEENFSAFHVDKACIGLGGISSVGVTDFHVEEAKIHRLMVHHAREAIVLADSAKLGFCAMVKVCSLEEIDTVITDSAASPRAVKELEDAGVRVLIAAES